MKTGSFRKQAGFFTGILFFVLILTLPLGVGLSTPARHAAACALLMAVWWITEAIPISATSLLPLALYPLLKIMDAKDVALNYADRNIFLFMGGFFIAMAMQRHNLHKRIALSIIYLLGTSSRKIILGFMAATAFLSMWISNTATAMMMLPIGLAVIDHVHNSVEKGYPDRKLKKGEFRFGLALMLGIAYSASIGGVGTLVGTPPNIVFAGMARSLFPQLPEIGFLQWMKIGIPIVLVFLPLSWAYIVFFGVRPEVNKIPGSKKIIREELTALGKMKKGELLTLIIFCLTALGWIFRQDIQIGSLRIPGWANLMGVEKYVHDSTVAMIGAILLFIIPTNLRKNEFILNWQWAVRIPWGILLLFGGGFALASSFQATGLNEWIGNIFNHINYVSVAVLILSICLFFTFLTEITSNTATITMMLPVLAALAVSMKIHPFILMVPATISTSFAFMMPVATPPNAIIFGSEYVKINQMAKTGVVLNLLGVIVITSAMYLIVFRVLGITL